ncbi:MAG: deoxyuridine 5'-triphosphate nucleotidohydrolase [Vicinamibacterales bacterium]
MEHSPGVLSRQEIDALLDRVPPLLDNLPDRAIQLQPNGIDITLERVSRFRGPGFVGLTNAERVLPRIEDLPFDPDGAVYLPPGAYQIRFNEIVCLPDWLMAYARPRSSLLRSGVALHTAVWDAGYTGRGVALMVVYHPAGFRISRDARVCQLVFHRLSAATEAIYAGAYQHEGQAGS